MSLLGPSSITNRHHSFLESDHRQSIILESLGANVSVVSKSSSVQKSASTLSAPASSCVSAAFVSTDVFVSSGYLYILLIQARFTEFQQERAKYEAAMATMRSKIPIVTVRTHRWSSNVDGTSKVGVLFIQ